MLRKYKVLLLDFDETLGSALLDWLESIGDINASAFGANQKEIKPEIEPDIVIQYQSDDLPKSEINGEFASIPQLIIGRGLKAAQSNGQDLEQIIINLPLRFVTLEAKIRQLLRIEADKQMKALKIGDYIFSPNKKALVCDTQKELKLTEKEISILTYLNQAAGASIGREELLREVWRYNDGITTHTLETHIYRLRQKLSEIFSNREIIITTEGGYRLQT